MRNDAHMALCQSSLPGKLLQQHSMHNDTKHCHMSIKSTKKTAIARLCVIKHTWLYVNHVHQVNHYSRSLCVMVPTWLYVNQVYHVNYYKMTLCVMIPTKNYVKQKANRLKQINDNTNNNEEIITDFTLLEVKSAIIKLYKNEVSGQIINDFLINANDTIIINILILLSVILQSKVL